MKIFFLLHIVSILSHLRHYFSHKLVSSAKHGAMFDCCYLDETQVVTDCYTLDGQTLLDDNGMPMNNSGCYNNLCFVDIDHEESDAVHTEGTLFFRYIIPGWYIAVPFETDDFSRK